MRARRRLEVLFRSFVHHQGKLDLASRAAFMDSIFNEFVAITLQNTQADIHYSKYKVVSPHSGPLPLRSLHA